jgi:transposase-like protein
LGLWIAETEGAKFWMGGVNRTEELGRPGHPHCVHGRAYGFPEAVRAVYPKTRVQLCIVHMIRNSTKFVSYKDLKKYAPI